MTTASAPQQGLKDGAAGLAAVRDYFGMKGAEFRSEWAKLTDQDKADLRNAVGTGTY